MKSDNPFIIQFSGLKDGKHDFQLNVEPKFFEQNDFWNDITGNLVVDLELDKRPNMLVLQFQIIGIITVPCDICSAPLNVDLTIEEELFVKFGNENYQETDEIIFLPESEYEIDLKPQIFEFISLSLPMKKIHKEGECDEEMIQTINKYKRGNEEQNDEIDPRWAALKNIKNN